MVYRLVTFVDALAPAFSLGASTANFASPLLGIGPSGHKTKSSIETKAVEDLLLVEHLMAVFLDFVITGFEKLLLG